MINLSNNLPSTLNMSLTIQLFHHGQWHDAAELQIDDPKAGRRGTIALGYSTDYAIDWMGRDDEHACSLNLPVELMLLYRRTNWFAMLDDIMPSGASRRYWVNRQGLQSLPPHEQDHALLAQGTIAPVGNLRIKQALPQLPTGSQLKHHRFTLDDVVERHTDFLEYAQQVGAAGGGATGAGGEAPKLLLRRGAQDEIWIDTWQDEPRNTDAHYLVKFPRGPRSDMDCDILRAEYHYYHELQALGFDTIDIRGMELIEGARYPSLWLPRFDVDFIEGERTLYGLESLYSLLEKPPGTFLNHFEAIDTLVARCQQQYRVREMGESFDGSRFVVEWVKRDLLNVAFGNSDNHGRNTAMIKRPDGLWLAPVYDFAPMKADPEGIMRTTQWGAPYEEGGRFDWQGIAQRLDPLVPADDLLAELRQLGRRLKGLKARLRQRGVPNSILDLPALGFDYLDDKLDAWRLT